MKKFRFRKFIQRVLCFDEDCSQLSNRSNISNASKFKSWGYKIQVNWTRSVCSRPLSCIGLISRLVWNVRPNSNIAAQWNDPIASTHQVSKIGKFGLQPFAPHSVVSCSWARKNVGAPSFEYESICRWPTQIHWPVSCYEVSIRKVSPQRIVWA